MGARTTPRFGGGGHQENAASVGSSVEEVSPDPRSGYESAGMLGGIESLAR